MARNPTVRRVSGHTDPLLTREDLGDVFDIEFGEGLAVIRVRARDGWVEVSTDETLIIEPIAGNTIRVATWPFGKRP